MQLSSRTRLPETTTLTVCFYGAPAVALAVILISFFTTNRRGGIVVPLCGWALLVADVAVMAAAVASQ